MDRQHLLSLFPFTPPALTIFPSAFMAVHRGISSLSAMALNSKVIPQRIQLLALGRRRWFALWHLGTTIPPGWKMNTVHANSRPALGEARPAPFSANTTNYRCEFATWPMLMFTLWWFLRGVCAHTNSMLFWLNYKRLLSKILSRTLYTTCLFNECDWLADSY